MTRWMLSCTIGVVLSGMAVQAHHSIADAYDSTREITIAGTIVQVQFVNPHPFVLVDVNDGPEHTQSWRLEMDNRGELIEVGFTVETLKAGDRITVRGNPARRQARSMYIRKLDRPADGFEYEQVGFSPVIRKRPR